MNFIRMLLLAVLVVAAGSRAFADEATVADIEFFEKRIRPVLI